MLKKQIYTAPEAEIMNFSVEGIVCESGTVQGSYFEETDYDDGGDEENDYGWN